MILVYGDPDDGPTGAVLRSCRGRRVDHALVDESRLGTTDVTLEIDGSGISGRIDHDGWSVDLARVTGVYYRPTGRFGEQPRQREAALAAAGRFRSWTELTEVPVANTLSAMASNGSKPYQATLIGRYFEVPTTLVTNDPDEVRGFLRRHGRVVYKSCSGVRSIVSRLDGTALERLEAIRWCPTQFQAQIEGTNVRVHVVGDRCIATTVATDAVDYRYAGRENACAQLDPVELPPDVAARCVDLCRSLGLTVGGVDLMQAGAGRWVCFEVNPSPGFTFFEEDTGQPVADAVVAMLSATAPRREV